MITKSFRLEDLEKVKICIGYVGENKHTQVRIDCSSAFAEYPGATPVLAVQPPRGGVYPAVIEQDGNVVVWDVTNSDLLFRGEGAFQFSFTLGDVVKKTVPGKFIVQKSIITTANVPAPVAEWLIRAEKALEGVEAAEINQPMIGLDGYWYKWDQEEQRYVSTGTKAQGQNGVGIASIVKTGTVGLVDTYTITFTNGTTTTYTVTNGEGGNVIDDTSTGLDKTWSANKVNTLKSALTPLTPSASAGDVGKFLKAKTVADGKVTEYEFGSGGGSVSDVKVNNVSVLDNGVAKIPLASSSAPGVVKVNAGGLQMVDDTIKIVKAQDSVVKDGTVETAPIVPSNQHISAFYALAKAAGDTSQASSANAVGSYTDDAKVKIQKMLGIYEAPWELIREDTVTNATETDVEIAVDGNGNAYELTDVYMQVWTPQQETAASIGDYGQVRSYYDSSNYITSQMNTWTQAANAAARYGQVLLKNENGAVLNVVTQNATQYSSVGLIGRTNIPNSDALLKVGTFAFDKIVIKKVTGTVNYKLYGKRKWN